MKILTSLLSLVAILALTSVADADHPQRVRAVRQKVVVQQQRQFVRHRHVQPIVIQQQYAQPFVQSYSAPFVQSFSSPYVQSIVDPCALVQPFAVQSFSAPYVQSFAAPVVFRQRQFVQYPRVRVRLPRYGFGFGF